MGAGRVVILTNCIALNGGDAAIVEATIESLRRRLGEATRFVVHDYHPDATRHLWPGVEVRPWSWNLFGLGSRGTLRGRLWQRGQMVRALVAAAAYGAGFRRAGGALLSRRERAFVAEYAAADLIVSKGGTYLVPNYDLRPHFFDYRLCRLLRRPLVLYTQSLGPFTSGSDVRAVRRLARDTLIMLRDDRSAEHLRAIGVDDVSRNVYADAAFTLADPDAVVGATRRCLPRTRPRVAVSVREWKHFAGDRVEGMRRYGDSMSAMVVRLVQCCDAQVTFVSTCQGQADYHTDDSRVAETIVDGLAHDIRSHVRVDTEFHNTADLKALLATFDFAISTRMHFAILALCSGVPVLPIAYEFKTAELARRIGLGPVLEIDRLEPSSAVDALDRFLASVDGLRRPLFARVDEERRRAELAADRAYAYFAERAK
jgi:colanic acid/amylovoran biosynthesis protein